MHCLTSSHYNWLRQWISPEISTHLTSDLDSSTCNLNDLLIAFTHPSYFGGDSEFGKRFERLEFLGDAAVNYFITEELYFRFPMASEGDLARVKAALISSEQLGKIVQALEMENLIYLGKGELEQKNFLALKQLGKFFEALMAALIQWMGFQETKEIFLKFVSHYEDKSKDLFFSLSHLETFDAKSRLQNLCLQKWKELPKYLSRSEKNHGQELFHVDLYIQDKIIAQSSSYSKKLAEKMAAEMAIERMNIC